LLSVPKNDIYKITFGNEFKKGVYRLQLESTNPVLSKEISIISLTTKLDITLTGSATINPEFQGLLFLRKIMILIYQRILLTTKLSIMK